MNLTARTKKIVALLSVGLLVVGVAFVAVLAVLVSNADEDEPVVSVFSNGRTVEVEPYLYCPVSEPQCTNVGETTELDTGDAPVVQLSLPTTISGAPWVLASVYTDADGAVFENSEFNLPGDRRSATIATTDEEGRRLVGIEVRLPTGIIDPETLQEEIVSHAVWSIATPV